ncbi:MAG TPA: hypothetical protein VIK59_03065 [Verrucomicrobiae bacterium]
MKVIPLIQTIWRKTVENATGSQKNPLDREFSWGRVKIVKALSTLLKIKVKPIKNRWVKSAIYLAIFVLICVGFSDLTTDIARGVFGKPLHPVGFWIASCLTILLSIWFFYWLVTDWYSWFFNHDKSAHTLNLEQQRQ